jgi:hypothetical protein
MEDNGHLRCDVKHTGGVVSGMSKNILPAKCGTKKDASY